ncbi:MAG: GNAT family N-acetyltransferase [Clostridia bacterium]|nr:GNAT family N-acetyltransferase [Clostridia bacterium]
MISVSEYKKDPCGTLSIPYYKARRIGIPEGVRVVHARDFNGVPDGCADELYFRLLHDLKELPEVHSARFAVRTAGVEDIPLIADIIDRSYEDMSVSAERLLLMRECAEFSPDLWIVAFDKESMLAAACGIAELDRKTGEGSLEWIQVLPGYRRRGAGSLIVAELLDRLRGKAAFVTVSGKQRDPLRPEALYRKCGFKGSDIWHVIREIKSV